MFTLENRLQGLRAWRLICITELVLATFSCDGEWHLGKVTDLILQCFSSSSRDQATVRSCCISDMNKAVLWKSLNQIWLVAESGAQLCPCHVCLPVATWGLCKREPLPPSQEVVAVSANLCLLKKKLPLKGYLSSSAAECFLMEEEKIHHGACAALGCVVLLFLDWTWGLMEWACQAKEVRRELVTGSARHAASLIALYHMQIGALTLKINPSPFNKHSGCLKYWLLVKMWGKKKNRGQTQTFCWFYQHGSTKVTHSWLQGTQTLVLGLPSLNCASACWSWPRADSAL